jgi:hypothetical protein
MIKLKLIILFSLLYVIGYSQIPGPTTNWYFGVNAGITFNSGLPVALTNGALITTEGVATISDNSGNLLFYTDGVTVYNRIHNVMTNGTGLFGHASSTQSAIIVQKPNQPNIYYIFTSDNDAGTDGICYSIVDMNLSAGLGAVTIKNTQLKTPSCEKLCAVRHCNNVDVWVISHDWGTNVFTTWSVNNFGVASITTWSTSGSVVSGVTQSSYGQLKSSPNGRRLAACHYGMNRIELHNFDPSTGYVSGGFTLSNETGIYGCEFSPDGRILYGGTNQGLLLQWDLCAGTQAQIQASRRVVSNAGPFIGSIQLGPDGKIYVARNNTSLAVINNPNVYGIGCNYSDLSIPLAGRSSRMGLPNFASFYIQPQFVLPNPTISCTTVSFQSPNITNNCVNQNNLYTYSWNFGDSQTSTQQNPTHIYLSSGVYNVSLTINGPCTSTTINKTINIPPGGITVSVYTN